MTIDSTSLNLWLAQEGPPAPTDTGGMTAQPGGTGGTGGTQGQAPPSNNFFFIMVLAVGAILIFSMMGQRRDKKKRNALLNAVKKHDRVQTIGGIVGSVVEIKPETVVLKVDESTNTRITFARSSVQQVLSSGKDSAETDSEITPE
ncbi:MAG: preprotein translocase subunit YajC [Planctomycetota bacterium]|nr:preprotein translocase subunit YajC [Planctomycetota bacterium]